MVLSVSAQRLHDCYTEGVAAYAAGQRAMPNPYYVADGGLRARAEAQLWMAGWFRNAPNGPPATAPDEKIEMVSCP